MAKIKLTADTSSFMSALTNVTLETLRAQSAAQGYRIAIDKLNDQLQTTAVTIRRMQADGRILEIKATPNDKGLFTAQSAQIRETTDSLLRQRKILETPIKTQLKLEGLSKREVQEVLSSARKAGIDPGDILGLKGKSGLAGITKDISDILNSGEVNKKIKELREKLYSTFTDPGDRTRVNGLVRILRSGEVTPDRFDQLLTGSVPQGSERYISKEIAKLKRSDGIEDARKDVNKAFQFTGVSQTGNVKFKEAMRDFNIEYKKLGINKTDFDNLLASVNRGTLPAGISEEYIRLYKVLERLKNAYRDVKQETEASNNKLREFLSNKYGEGNASTIERIVRQVKRGKLDDRVITNNLLTGSNPFEESIMRDIKTMERRASVFRKMLVEKFDAPEDQAALNKILKEMDSGRIKEERVQKLFTGGRAKPGERLIQDNIRSLGAPDIAETFPYIRSSTEENIRYRKAVDELNSAYRKIRPDAKEFASLVKQVQKDSLSDNLSSGMSKLAQLVVKVRDAYRDLGKEQEQTGNKVRDFLIGKFGLDGTNSTVEKIVGRVKKGRVAESTIISGKLDKSDPFEANTIRDLEKLNKVVEAKKAIDDLKIKFPAPDAADTTATKAYYTELEKIERLLVSGKLKTGDFNTSRGDRVTSNLRSPGNIARAQSEIESRFDTSSATPKQLRSYNDAVNSVLSTVGKANIDISRFKELLKSDVNLSGITIDERKVVSGVNAIRSALTDTAKTTDSAILSLRNFARISQSLTFKMAAGAVIQPVLTAVPEGAREANNYEVIISQIRAITQQANSSTDDWSASLRRLSDSFGFPLLETAEAAYKAIQNQVANNIPETEKFISVAAELARVSRSSLGASVESLTSVLNGFQEGTDKASLRAAQLFKIAEIGRVSLDEISTSLGRATPTASLLGISFEELGGAVSLLTRQGVKPSESITQLVNIMAKLIKPTEETSQLISSLGFSSSEAAIKALTFVGLLDKMAKSSNGASTEIGKLFNEIRGRSGFLGLTQNLFEGYGGDIKQIRDAGTSFEKGKEIRRDTAGDRLIKEGNKIATFFTEDVGRKVTNTLDGLNNRLQMFGGTASIVESSFRVITENMKILLPLMFGYNVLMKNRAAIEAAQSAINAGGSAVVPGKGRANLIAGITGVTAVVGVINLFSEVQQKRVDDIQNSIDKIRDAYKDMDKFDPFKKMKKNLDSTSLESNLFNETIMSSTTDRYAAVTDELKTLKTAAIDAVDAVREAMNEVNKGISSDISELDSKIQAWKSATKETYRNSRDIDKTLKDSLRDFELRFGSPQQKVQTLFNRSEDTNRDIQELLKSNRPEDLVRGQQLITKLYNERLAYDSQAAQNNIDNTPRGKNYEVQVGYAQAQLKAMQELSAKFDKRIAELAKTRIAELEKDKLKLSDTLKATEAFFKRLEKFTGFNDEGKVKSIYIDRKTGKIDRDKFSRDFEAQGDIPREVDDKKTLISARDKMRQTKLDELDKAIEQEKLAEVQNRSKKQLENLEKNRSNVETGRNASFDKARSQLLGIGDVLNTLRDNAGKLQDNTDRTRSGATNLTKIKTRIDEAGNLLRNTLGADETNFLERFKLLNETLQKLKKDLSPNEDPLERIFNSETIDKLYQSLLQLNKVDVTSKIIRDAQLAEEKFQRFGIEVQEIINDIDNEQYRLKVLENEKFIGEFFGVETEDQLRRIDEKILSIRGSLIRLRQSLEGTRDAAPEGIFTEPARDNGGFVYGRGGMDNIQTRIGAGEFVMNREAAARNAGILQYLNMNKMSFGDINVSYGRDGGQSGQDIIQLIRRAQRTGQL